MFPFENDVLAAIIEESQLNRKLAIKYLDYEIRVAFPEIMKRIQTSKAAKIILNFSKQYIGNLH